jgi:hypothetical protein
VLISVYLCHSTVRFRLDLELFNNGDDWTPARIPPALNGRSFTRMGEAPAKGARMAASRESVMRPRESMIMCYHPSRVCLQKPSRLRFRKRLLTEH